MPSSAWSWMWNGVRSPTGAARSASTSGFFGEMSIPETRTPWPATCRRALTPVQHPARWRLSFCEFFGVGPVSAGRACRFNGDGNEAGGSKARLPGRAPERRGYAIACAPVRAQPRTLYGWAGSVAQATLRSGWPTALCRWQGCGPKEHTRSGTQGVCELHQHVDAQIDRSTFDSLLVREVNLCRLSKGLLGKPLPPTEAPHVGGDVPKGLDCPGTRHPVRLPAGCDRNKSTKSSLR